ncbi:MAG TPA: aldehyde dehydrogenase family protein, partial [Actinomycetota bacterium]|nr:aldehyde dehydrogenase family protein [Actinomycetota bacterium]
RERAAYLLKVADLVKQNAKHLAELESRDAGHTSRMSKGADIGMVISTFRVFAEIAGKEADEQPLPRNPGSTNYVRYDPIGVCAAITPWNFPIQMAAWKIAPAIAAGNTVVIKPANLAPLTTIEVGRLCMEAGIPNGVVNVLPGTGAKAGEPLVASPLVDKVAFTGSTEVGRRIMELSASNIKKVTLELGGKSAAIVLDDVNLDYAVDGALWGIFFHSGQVCSAGTRLLVQRGIYDDFIAELAKRAEGIRVGPAMDPASDMGPVISEGQLQTIERYVEITMPMSAPLDIRVVWPASRDSSSARCFAFCLTRSATLSKYAARSRPFILGQGPSSKAVRAARMARSTSSLWALATVANGSPVEGSMVSNVSPDAALVDSPSMSS